MGLLVGILVVTNVISLAVLLFQRRVPGRSDDEVEVFEAPRPAGISERNRRLITIEILNPLEVASHRGGRVAGLAGALAPGFTRRVVYDRTLKTLRRELDDKAVHADVRLHTVHPLPARDASLPPVVEVPVVDEVAPLDLSEPR